MHFRDVGYRTGESNISTQKQFRLRCCIEDSIADASWRFGPCPYAGRSLHFIRQFTFSQPGLLVYSPEVDLAVCAT